MVNISSGSQLVIGNDLWLTSALAFSGVFVMLYGSQQLLLSMGYWSCCMVHNSSSFQWVIGHVIWFTKALALSVLLVLIYGSQ